MTETGTGPASASRRDVGGRRLRLLTAIGLACLLAGLGFLAWFVWDSSLRPSVDVAETQRQVQVLREQWRRPAPVPSPAPGDPLALLRIPALGPGFEVPVFVGTDEASLGRGVGWFEHTAGPGQVGNFAIAGRRGPQGPFDGLLGLPQGALIEVETRSAIHTYRLTGPARDLTVEADQTWVLDPVPGKPDETPTKALITLVTSRGFAYSPERSVGFGELVGTQPKRV